MGKKRKFRRRTTAHSSCVAVTPPTEDMHVQHVGEDEVYTAIEYAGDKRECVKLPERAPILMINSTTYGVLRCLMDKFPHSEWGMYLRGYIDEDGDGVCSSHVIPKQRVTGASVLPDSTVDDVVCWLHSHHTMGAWHSGTDREYANYPFIATVSLQQGKFDISAKKRITLPCCNKYVLVDTNVQFYFSDAEEENIAEENIKSPPPVVTSGGQLYLPDYQYQTLSEEPEDANKYHPVGHPCKFGVAEKQEGCRWRCRAAVKNFYKDKTQHILCDEQRARALAEAKARETASRKSTSPEIHPLAMTYPPNSASASRESETEEERNETKPFAPACREALAIYSLNGEKVVAVVAGTVCPAKGYACQISCRHAISCRRIEQGINVVFCVRKAEARRQAALEEIYAENPVEPETLFTNTSMESNSDDTSAAQS
jgi:hypothetical protein